MNVVDRLLDLPLELAGPYTTVTMSLVKFPFPGRSAGGNLRLRT